MLECERCHKTFNHKSSYYRHKSKSCHTGSSNKCEYCGKQCRDVSNLMRHIKTTHNSHNTVMTTNHHHYTTIINNPIYLSRDPSFLEKLIKLKGGQEEALNAIKEAIYNEVKGEVKLFGEMYLQGDDPTKWPIICVDEKTRFFKIRMEDGTWLSDPDGVESRRRFYGNYTDSVLILMNQFMFLPVVDHGVELDDFSDRAGEKMDHVDLKTIQNRLTVICSQKFNQELFAKELTKLYFKRIRDIQNSKKDCDILLEKLTHI